MYKIKYSSHSILEKHKHELGLKMLLDVVQMWGIRNRDIICSCRFTQWKQARPGTQQPIPRLTSSLSVCVAPPLITNMWNIRGNGEYVLRAYISLLYRIPSSVCRTRQGERQVVLSSVWLSSSINCPRRIIQEILKVHKKRTDACSLLSISTCAVIQLCRSAPKFTDISYEHWFEYRCSRTCKYI